MVRTEIPKRFEGRTIPASPSFLGLYDTKTNKFVTNPKTGNPYQFCTDKSVDIAVRDANIKAEAKRIWDLARAVVRRQKRKESSPPEPIRGPLFFHNQNSG